MARVKRAVHSKKHRRAILERAKGYYGNKSRSYRAANEQVMHSLQYAFRDRRARKGEFRKLWIQRINAACRQNGISYSRFIAGLNAAGIEVDRKVLADLAVTDPAAFGALVERAKAAVDEKAANAAASEPRDVSRRPDTAWARTIRRSSGCGDSPRDRSARDEEQAFVIEGPVLVREALAPAWPLEAVFVGRRARRARRRRRADGHRSSPTACSSGWPTTVTPQPVRRGRPPASGRRRRPARADASSSCSTRRRPRQRRHDPPRAEAAGAAAVVVGGGRSTSSTRRCVRPSAGALFFTVLAVVATMPPSALAVVGELGHAAARHERIRRRALRRASTSTGPVARRARQRGPRARRRRRSAVDELVTIPMVGGRVAQRGHGRHRAVLRGRPPAARCRESRFVPASASPSALLSLDDRRDRREADRASALARASAEVSTVDELARLETDLLGKRSDARHASRAASASLDARRAQGGRPGAQRGDRVGCRRARAAPRGARDRSPQRARSRAERLDLTEVPTRPPTRPPPPRHPDARAPRGRVRRPGLHRRRGPRGRERLVQLHGAQHAARPPGARACRTRSTSTSASPAASCCARTRRRCRSG